MPRPLSSRLIAACLFSLALLCLTPAEASADTITLTAVQQGWYTSEGTNNGVQQVIQPNNYFVGVTSGRVYRNYFVFNAGSVMNVTSARIVIEETGGFKFNPDPHETYTLFGVQTPGEQLGRVAGVSIYEDLGSGPVYGSIDVSYSFFGRTLTIDLNAEALQAINNTDWLFAIGGAITSLGLPPGAEERLFSSSGNSSVRLIVEGEQRPTPEPGTILLLGTGLAGAAQVLRRRRAA